MTGVAGLLDAGPVASGRSIVCPEGTAQWAEVADRAGRMASMLATERDVEAGAVIQLPSEPNVASIATILATWIAGGTICVEGGRPGDRALGSSDFGAVTAEHAKEYWDRAAERGPSLNPTDHPDQVLIRQRTSGTTGRPEEIEVTASALGNHAASMASAAGLSDPDEVAFSWLPLFHDMGLVGMLCLPLIHGQQLVLESPSTFRRDPTSWFAACAHHRATYTAAPDFAYRIALRLSRRTPLGMRAMRALVNGGEPIRAATVADLARCEAAGGLTIGAHRPAYGLAQAPLCVSITRSGRGGETVRSPLERNRDGSPHLFADERFVVLGEPIEGVSVTVERPSDVDLLLPDGVGELVVRGHVDAARSVRTGDLGFLTDGRVVVCGRTKDIIVIGGRNVLPEAVECAAEGVAGVRPGGVLAFADRDGAREWIVVVCEAGAPPAGLEASIVSAVLRAAGSRPEVVLVAPHSLPKTTSGKLQRARCREMHHGGGLTPA